MTDNNPVSSTPAEAPAIADFSQLGLSDKVLSAVRAMGYTEPTPIQAQAIPAVLEHQDVLGIAQTGTGKTASFVLPMLTLLEHGRARIRMPRTMIIAPTRELAAQIAENFEKYGKNHRLNVALLIGGVSFDDQGRKLERGADVLIATPGRLLDHYERGKILLTGVELLVIDEADRMLDMGFIPDIEKICKLIPMTRQTLLFSATMPPELEKLAAQFLHAPVRIEAAAASSAAQTITQYLVKSNKKPWDKRLVLRELIKSEGEKLKNAIIFCNRKRDVSELFRSLDRHGFSAGALHGDMDQRSRTTMLENFRRDKLQLLVASDVAARGLDIPDVSHVFNFDVPFHSEDYVHRIGRTGRAGREGTAYTIVTRSDAGAVESIEKIIGETIPYLSSEALNIPEETADSDDAREGNAKTRPPRERAPRGRRRGRAPAADDAAASSEVAEKVSSAVKELVRTEAKPRFTRPAPRDRDRDTGPKVVGFGDNVPAFMLIPTQ